MATGHDKDAGTLTGPAGWAEVLAHSSTSVSIWVGCRVAAGGETTATVSCGTTSAGSGDTMWIGEFTDPASGTWAVLTVGTHTTDESTVTSWSSGTAADPGRTCSSIAAFAIDSASSSTGSETWTNSYAELVGWGTSNAGVAVGWLASTSGAQSTTHGHTGTADQVSAAVATFGKAIPVTGSVAVTAGISGGIATGLSGSRATTVGLSGGLRLGAVTPGSRATTVGLSGGIDVISRAFTCTLEIEFTAGVWTDVTSRLAFRSGPLKIKRGRATEYDDITPGVLTCTLFNDDGEIMPENPASTFYPNVAEGKRIRWRVTKMSVTYTRFLGWIQAIRPEFPTSSTTGSVVQITATDALGLLAQRKLRSNFTEAVLQLARTASVPVDVYEATGKTSGIIALMTNYSPDSTKGTSRNFVPWNTAILNFGDDDDVSIGGVCTSNADLGAKVVDLFQASPLQVVVHFKTPNDVVTAGTRYYVTTFHSSPGSSASLCHLAVVENAGTNRLVLRNAGDTADLAVIGNISAGHWVKVSGISRASSPSTSDWKASFEDGTSTSATSVSVDVRSIRGAEFPSAVGTFLRSSWGGVTAIGTRTEIPYADSWSTVGTRDLPTRVGLLGDACDQLPCTVSMLGTDPGLVATGTWSGRYALEVLTEMMRTHDGITWALPWTDTAHGVARSLLYASTPVVTIDSIDPGDCVGPPSLVVGAESRPTRVDARWPGGVETSLQADAETAGQVRTRTVDTVAPSQAVARAAAQAVLGRAWAGRSLRISQVKVSLVTAVTDHTAALFDESGDLGGLYPTQRVTVTVPTSHFGVSSMDCWVYGWLEEYAPRDVTIKMDTAPVPVEVTVTETFTGANGSALPALWVEGFTYGGGTATIQGNQARLASGADANGTLRRRYSGRRFSDFVMTGKFTLLQSAGALQVWYRGDDTLAATGYYLRIDSTGNQYIRAFVGVPTPVAVDVAAFTKTVTAGTQYGFRIQAEGSRHRARVWAASGAEPGTWDVDTTTTVGPYSTGWVGIAAISDGVNATSRSADFDDFTIIGW